MPTDLREPHTYLPTTTPRLVPARAPEAAAAPAVARDVAPVAPAPVQRVRGWRVPPVLVGCAAFMALFVAWRHLKPGGIMFYQCIALGVVVALAQALLTWRTRPRGEAAKDGLMTFLLVYSFVFTVPTTVDRAYSVRMIAQLDASPNGMTRADVQRWFAADFGEEGVGRRLMEQRATGSVVERDGRYVLTPVGRFLAAAFRVTAAAFASQLPGR
jgi:hypothetical protein